MQRTKILVVVCLALLMVGCGSKSASVGPPPPPPPPVTPLDPQGNWLFTLTGTNETLVFAGQLYELVSPTVTSNPMGPVGVPNPNCTTSFSVGGQASGINTIDLNVVQQQVPAPASAFALTGTIADSQAAMSGTWTTTTAGLCMSGTSSGTWTATLLTAATGNWSGILTGNAGSITVTLGLTENVDQTSPNMGQITGEVTITGSPCFSAQLTIPDWTSGGSSLHAGETLIVATAPDVNGATTQESGTVDPGGTTYTVGSALSVFGGPCAGQTFLGTLTKQ